MTEEIEMGIIKIKELTREELDLAQDKVMKGLFDDLTDRELFALNKLDEFIEAQRERI